MVRINLEDWSDKLCNFIEEVSGDSFQINREIVATIALNALKCLQVALLAAAFYSRPQTFAIGFYIGAFSPVLFPQLKEIIVKIESAVRQSDLHWGFFLAGTVLFSVLPSTKWPLATLAYSIYLGDKFFHVPTEGLENPVENPLNESSFLSEENEESQTRFTRIRIKVFKIIRDNGLKFLDISACLFLFALKPVVLPIAFVAGAVLPEQARKISKHVALIWKFNKTRFILHHLTVPFILPTYLWIAATIYGLHKGTKLADDTSKKERQYKLDFLKKV